MFYFLFVWIVVRNVKLLVALKRSAGSSLLLKLAKSVLRWLSGLTDLLVVLIINYIFFYQCRINIFPFFFFLLFSAISNSYYLYCLLCDLTFELIFKRVHVTVVWRWHWRLSGAESEHDLIPLSRIILIPYRHKNDYCGVCKFKNVYKLSPSSSAMVFAYVPEDIRCNYSAVLLAAVQSDTRATYSTANLTREGNGGDCRIAMIASLSPLIECRKSHLIRSHHRICDPLLFS